MAADDPLEPTEPPEGLVVSRESPDMAAEDPLGPTGPPEGPVVPRESPERMPSDPPRTVAGGGGMEKDSATAPGSRCPLQMGANNDGGHEGRRSDKDDGDP